VPIAKALTNRSHSHPSFRQVMILNCCTRSLKRF
jgi:hypothetical protein